MAVTYHAVVIRRANGTGGALSEYAVVGIVDASSSGNPNFIEETCTTYTRAEWVASAMNAAVA